MLSFSLVICVFISSYRQVVKQGEKKDRPFVWQWWRESILPPKLERIVDSRLLASLFSLSFFRRICKLGVVFPLSHVPFFRFSIVSLFFSLSILGIIPHSSCICFRLIISHQFSRKEELKSGRGVAVCLFPFFRRKKRAKGLSYYTKLLSCLQDPHSNKRDRHMYAFFNHQHPASLSRSLFLHVLLCLHVCYCRKEIPAWSIYFFLPLGFPSSSRFCFSCRGDSFFFCERDLHLTPFILSHFLSPSSSCRETKALLISHAHHIPEWSSWSSDAILEKGKSLYKESSLGFDAALVRESLTFPHLSFSYRERKM